MAFHAADRLPHALPEALLACATDGTRSSASSGEPVVLGHRIRALSQVTSKLGIEVAADTRAAHVGSSCGRNGAAVAGEDRNGSRAWLVVGGIMLLLFAAAAGGEAVLTVAVLAGIVWFVARLGRSSGGSARQGPDTTSEPSKSRTGLSAHHTPSRQQTSENRAVQRRYFDLMQDLEGAKSRGDFDRAVASASSSVELLPQFVEAWKDEQHRVSGEARFDIATIPAIDTLCQLGPARGEADLLRQARNYLAPIAELAPWVDKLDQAIEDAAGAVEVVKRLADDPGVRQAGLAKKLGLDGHRVRSTLYWMERDGEIVRVKDGKTHRLYLPMDAPEPKPSVEPSPTTAPPPVADGAFSAPVSFAAIDCETATGHRNSICAVGLVIVNDGKLVAKRTWLVQPPGNRYWSTNIAVHGISPLDTADAAPIGHLWAEIHGATGGLPLVAHNAAFDRSAIETSLTEAGWKHPLTYEWYCTLSIARRIWPQLANHTLPTVAAHCGHRLEHHHDAAADAEAAARIAIAACTALSAVTLKEAAGRR